MTALTPIRDSLRKLKVPCILLNIHEACMSHVAGEQIIKRQKQSLVRNCEF